MPDQQPAMSNEAFQTMCLEQTYRTLAESPAKYNLSPVGMYAPPGEGPRLTCPGCMKTYEVVQPGFIQTCDNCQAGLLIVDTLTNNKPGKKPRKPR